MGVCERLYRRRPSHLAAGFSGWRTEQVTSGPTEEEGISITSDGMSFITSVGNGHKTVWILDKNGQRQMSSEGTAFHTTFSSDGASLLLEKRWR